MKLYLFPAFSSDMVINDMLELREDPHACYPLYTRLFDFTGRRAFTASTAREYAVRLMLKCPPDPWREDLMLPYLKEDARRVFESFFVPEWDDVCREAGMLPFPRSDGRHASGEPAYRGFIAGAVESKSPEELCGKIAAFLRDYRDENEAMYRAFRFDGELTGVETPDPITFEDLYGLEYQKDAIISNTRGFLNGLPANDILLVGGGGTGKSSCVKATLNRFAGQGLRMVEVPNTDLELLPALFERLAGQRQRYIVFLDDLSFEGADEKYLSLKVALDGRVTRRPDNVLIYATSNRRNLVRETWSDRNDEDIHLNDTVGEKMSLSQRFGIRLYFPYVSQAEYLGIVRMLLEARGGVFTEEVGKRAVAWATENSGRSGRTARQFVLHCLNG